MKRYFISIAFLSLLISASAWAQYYNPYYYNPYFYNYYGCLKGCGKANTVATGINMGFDSLYYGMALHDYSKEQNAIVQQYQSQAEASRSQNRFLKIQDYYNNMQNIAPFFDSANPSPTVKKTDPQISPIGKTGDVQK
ncbi:MAG: hypothetical protein JNK65_00425 [Deltaproteobacteria bacterium]|nr:hypothetical protein [Deltaproteobacteria bacterium]